MVCGRSEPDALPTEAGRTAAFTAADVRDINQGTLIAVTVAELGSLDVVVNNAGGTPPAFVAGISSRFLTSISR